MIYKVKDISAKDFSGGLNTISDFFSLKPNESPDSMDMKFNFDGSVQKRPGCLKKNTSYLTTGSGFGAFDFGVANINNVLVAAGTGVLFSTDLGVTWTNIQSSKTATITYFTRIKDYAIYTDDAYDVAYYWNGSAAVKMAILNVSAPLCRFALDFQGFGILMNQTSNTLKVFYEDNNTLLSGDWGDSFTLPGSRSDEVTGGAVLNNKAYIFTKYKIFRLTYVGGNPDFAYVEVKSFGFVPDAWDKVSLGDVGEVIIGLCYDKRIRLFDGSDDKLISDKVENDNGLCSFALSKINETAIDKSNSKTDLAEQVWKLNVAIAPSTNLTHMLCLNLRNLAFYAYNYSTPIIGMVMTESAKKQYLVGVGNDANFYQMDTSNTDATFPIPEYFTSPFIFSDSPASVTKGQKANFFFAVSSANNVYMDSRTNFSNTWERQETFVIPSITSSNQIKRAVDVPITFNAYQYRLSSSAGTSEAWKLNRVDGLFKSSGYGAG